MTRFAPVFGQFPPSDLDESANQEPPTVTRSGTFSYCFNFISDTSNSSSGYFSSQSNSQSAPATCKDRYNNSSPVQANTSHSGKRESDLFGSHQLFHSATLNRTTSCCASDSKRSRKTTLSAGWLVKRRKSGDAALPKIARIMRKPSLKSPRVCELPEPEVLEDCNSAPAYLSCMDKPTSGPARFNSSMDFRPLSPVEEIASQPVEIDCCDTSLSSPVLAKRIKLSSTVKIEPSNDLIRHHSTPVSNFSSQNLRDRLESDLLSPVAPQDVKVDIMKRMPCARTLSVPANPSSDKFDLGNGHDLSDTKTTHILPVCDRTSSGINCISVDTVSDLLQEKFQFKNSAGEPIKHQYLIVDCRYPYEYDGGHLDGAINIYTHSDLILEIFNRVPARRPGHGAPTLLGSGLQQRLAQEKEDPVEDSIICKYFTSDCNDDLTDPQESEEHVNDRSSILFATESPVITPPEVEELHMDILHASMNHSRSRNPSLAEISQNSVSDAVQTAPANNSISSSSSSGGTSNSAGQTVDEPSFIVIFHCEFSSQRAPSLATFLRSIDRKSNFDRYPFLYFPEVYVMKGGYSSFYKKYPKLCTPKSYTTMFDRTFKREMSLYKRMTKLVSDACLSCVRQQTIPTMKLTRFHSPASQNDDSGKLTRAKTIGIVPEPPKSALPPLQVFADRKSGDSDSSDSCIGDELSRKRPREPTHRQLFENSPSSCDSSALSGVIDSSTDQIDDCQAAEASSLDFAERIVRVGRRVISATLGTKLCSLASKNVDFEVNKADENEPLNYRLAKVDLNTSTSSEHSTGLAKTPILNAVTKPKMKRFQTALVGFGQPETPIDCSRLKRSSSMAPKPLGSLDLNTMDDVCR